MFCKKIFIKQHKNTTYSIQ